MSACNLYTSGVVELYFYGELDPPAHARMDRHVLTCMECRCALEDLRAIREALSARLAVEAPDGGEWAPFMARLDEAVRRESSAAPAPSGPGNGIAFSRRPASAGYLAMAALLALVTSSVFVAWHTTGGREGLRRAAGPGLTESLPPDGRVAAEHAETHRGDPAFLALSEQHFERSKLVVLGLAAKDPAEAGADWEYERDLAGTLLTDTRLYRLAAEERGLTSLARVLQDLELVLLQASMSRELDAGALEQLQTLIRKRDLVTKIELVTTTAGL